MKKVVALDQEAVTKLDAARFELPESTEQSLRPAKKLNTTGESEGPALNERIERFQN